MMGSNRYMSRKGSNNLLIGANAGMHNSGYQNQFIGDSAGVSNTTGRRNQFIGSQSGMANTTGSYNQFSGFNSGYSNTTGSYNYFDGYAAGYTNTTGQENHFSGYISGTNTTTGSYNVFTGMNSGRDNTTGSFNTFLGRDAGLKNTIGDNNCYVGNLAGFGNLTGYSNTSIGCWAGYDNDGKMNTFVGDSADVSISGLTNATAIGYNTKVSQSNSLILGNNVNVGIGTTSPSQKLHIKNSSNFSAEIEKSGSTGGYAQWLVTANNGTNTGVQTVLFAEDGGNTGGVGTSSGHPFYIRANGQERMRFDTAGNVGIGTSSPSALLTVSQSSDAQHGLRVTDGTKYSNINIQPLTGANSGYSVFNFNGYWDNGEQRYNTARWRWRMGTDQRGITDQFFIDGWDGSTIHNLFIIDTLGNVGIGKSPGGKLDLNTGTNQDATFSTYANVGTNNFNILTLSNTNSGTGDRNYLKMHHKNGDCGLYSYSDASGTDALLVYFTTSGFKWENSSSTDIMFLTNGGKLGIGTASPSEKLSVSGNICYTGSIGSCSDRRYKTNILSMGSMLSNVMALAPVTYNWKVKEFPDKNFNDKKQLGFIAQDIEKIFPELVLTDQDGYKSVDYVKITPILVKAVQEQQSEIEALKKQNEQILAKLNSLEAGNNKASASIK